DKIIKNSIRALIKDTGLPLVKVSGLTGIESRSILSWRCGADFDFKEKHLNQMAANLGICSDHILNQNYDRSLVRARFLGSPHALPEKYAVTPVSFVRSSAHILNYIKMMHGQEFSDSILLKL